MSLVLSEVQQLDLSRLQSDYDPTYMRDYPGENGNFSGSLVVVGGSGDPSMDANERLCQRLGIPFIHALNERGGRVNPNPDEVYNARWDPRVLNATRAVVMVECDFIETYGLSVPVIYLDHHGDHAPEGLDKTPKNAFLASDHGQLTDFLGQQPEFEELEVGYEDEIVGALDHYAASVLDETGTPMGTYNRVNPKDGRQVMVHEIVRGARGEVVPSSASMLQVDGNIDKVRDDIQAAKGKRLGKLAVRDMRDFPLGRGFSETSQVLKAGACISGEVVLVHSPDFRSGAVKAALTGAVTPRHVGAFLRMAEEEGFQAPFYDMHRGIVMAYLPGELKRVGART